MERLALYAAFVGAVEGDVEGGIFVGPGGAQDRGQGSAGPFRVADRAGRPRVARSGPHALHVGPPIAGALHRRHDRPGRKAVPQLVKRQVQRGTYPASHTQPMGRRVQHRNVAVAADKEAVLWRDEAGAQLIGQWLRIIGLLRMDDEAGKAAFSLSLPRSGAAVTHDFLAIYAGLC